MPARRCRAGIKKGGSYASLLPMRTVRATRRGSLGSDAGINRYQEWVQRLPWFPNDRQDPAEVHHPRSPALGTSDTSYMQQVSGLLRTGRKFVMGIVMGNDPKSRFFLPMSCHTNPFGGYSKPSLSVSNLSQGILRRLKSIGVQWISRNSLPHDVS